MIKQIVSHKALGLGAAFLNVVFAAAVLDRETSLLYLTCFSIVQILMAYAGCGVAHKLVTLTEQEALTKKTWPWFLLSLVIGGIVLGFQAYLSDAPLKTPIFIFMLVIATLAVLSEWIRCAIARHSGFVIYNVLILATAITILITGTFGAINIVFAVAAVLLLLVLEFREVKHSGPLLPLAFADVVRAGRIASLNQYYNITIYLVSIFSNTGIEVLTLILAYRFNIFFNWQSFYWLRFGHKRLGSGIGPDHYKDNFKALGLNFLAITGVTVVAAVLLYKDILTQYTARGFDNNFLYLLMAYGWSRAFLNFLFPFELFVLYGTDLATDVRFVVISIVSFFAIAIASMYLPSIIPMMIFVELVWLAWRIYSKRIFENKYESTSVGFIVWKGE